MMKKILTVTALTLCMAAAITGCGSKASKKTDTKSTTKSTTIETSDIKNETETEKQTEKNTTETTSGNETGTEETSPAALQNTPASADVPSEAGSMLLVAHSLALCESETNTSYNGSDTSYFWNATSYLMAGYGMQSAAADIDEEGKLSLPSSTVKEFAAAIFSGYDGNTEPLPEIPGNITSVSYNADNDSYSVGAGGNESTKITTLQCVSNGDGSHTISVALELNDDSGTVLGKWDMGIKPSTFTGSGHPLFNYTVISFEKTND